MTLAEILKDRELPVKVKRPGLDETYCEIIAVKEDAIGFFDDGNGASFDLHYSSDWEIYTEVKKKVKVALHTLRQGRAGYIFCRY